MKEVDYKTDHVVYLQINECVGKEICFILRDVIYEQSLEIRVYFFRRSVEFLVSTL